MPLILEFIFFDPTRNKRKSRNLRDTFSDKQFYLGLRIVEREQNKLINEDGIINLIVIHKYPELSIIWNLETKPYF